MADHCLAFALSDPNNSVAVAGVLRDVLVTLKEHRPELEKVYCKQDNASCYHCGSQLLEVSQAIMRVSRCRDLNFQILKVARERPTARQLQ